jgi:hypothetical protein
MLHTINGNGNARSPGERGVSVAHRKDSKHQRAAKAGIVYDRHLPYLPTLRELALAYGVSVTLINRARKLPTDELLAVAAGHIGLPPVEPAQRAMLPTTPAPTLSDDATLYDVVRIAGVERILNDVAAAVEREASQ